MSTSSSNTTRRCIQFSLEDIKAATNQFSTKILGHGGEAVVYYAEIYIDLNKIPVAVKQLKDKRDNSEEFENEIQILSKIQHPNIVTLIGYCNESGHKILIYEYMENGSLSGLLKKKHPNALTWLQRLNICLDVARGLQHLHTETHEFPKGIIHRDMKPGNILVGEKWVGKVSDFGMFKMSTAGQDKSTMVTAHKGTSGYFAPEYVLLGNVTRKIDVFSFGVVLFYVLCNKSPWDREDESYFLIENDNLGIWALDNIDAQIKREISGNSLTLFTDIIRRSLQMNPGKRPSMDNVVLELQKVLECHESDTQEETYLEENPGEGPPMDDQNFQESENSPSELEGSPRNGRCRKFSYEEIKAAKYPLGRYQIFNQGEGKYVYYAEIYIGSNITPVAVKYLNDDVSSELERKVHTLSKMQHPNIVSLLGYCNERFCKIIVSEYMVNGRLSDHINNKSPFSWSWLRRLKVCLDAARGLQHLHKETDEFPKGIIHWDVKLGNILLDGNWVAKLSHEFAMFKLPQAGREESTMITCPNGKLGYTAPEYIRYGRVTRKTDVYAFGIVLFQVLCLELPWDGNEESYQYYENEDLGIWAGENVDSRIGWQVSGEALTLFTHVLGRCLQTDPGKRPTMEGVMLDLQKAIECQEYEDLKESDH